MSAASGRMRSSRQHEGGRRRARRGGSSPTGPSADGEQDDPAARGGERLDAARGSGSLVGRAGRRARRGTRSLGRRRWPRSTCGPTRTARRRSSVHRGVAADRGDGPQARRSGWVGGRERTEGVDHVVAGRRAVGPLDAGDDEGALGERAGLVEADDVDAGQHLDRRQLLHQHLPPAEAGDADGEGDAREQHEALGDHGADARRPSCERVAELVGAAHLGDDEQDADGQQQPAADPEDRVDAVAQLRSHGRELLRLLRQLRGVGVGARPRWPRMRPLPAATKLPDSTCRPDALCTGSLSPVRSDSSTSSPAAVRTTPSTGIWSPGPSSTTSPSHDVLGGDLVGVAVADDADARRV